VDAGELKKSAGILSSSISDPWTIRLFAFGTQVLIKVSAVSATLQIAAAVRAQPIFILNLYRKDGTTVVTLPHSQFPFL